PLTPPPVPCTTLFRSQVHHRGVLLHRSHEGLEHQVELARRGELALAALRAERPPRAAVLAGLATRDLELVALGRGAVVDPRCRRSEEHTSELQSPDHL